MERLAIHLEMNREMNDPVMPMKADTISKWVRLRGTPFCCSSAPNPSKWNRMLTTAMMAMLVKRNNSMRMERFSFRVAGALVYGASPPGNQVERSRRPSIRQGGGGINTVTG